MSQFAAVRETLHRYFDGLYTCDTDVLGSAFHERAIYACADESPLLFRTLDDYLPVVAKRVSPASRGEARRDSIDAVRFAGEHTAFAEVRCTIAGKDFVDFLTLVQTDHQWRIISKVFHIAEDRKREEA